MTTKTYSQFFVTDKRDERETFVKLSDDCPEWMRDLVYEVHNGRLPDDWIFEECRSAFKLADDLIARKVSPRDWVDALHEHADSRVDVYTHDVFRWATDKCNSSLFDDAEEEAIGLGTDLSEGSVKVLMAVQLCAIKQIAVAILEGVKEHLNDEASGEEVQP